MSEMFSVEDRSVLIVNEHGEVALTMKPLGVNVTDLIAIPIGGNPGAVVLLDGGAEGGRGWDNIVGIDVTGSIVWRAKRPGYITSAPYRYIRLRDGRLYGYADSGFEVLLNPDTGEIEQANWTK